MSDTRQPCGDDPAPYAPQFSVRPTECDPGWPYITAMRLVTIAGLPVRLGASSAKA